MKINIGNKSKRSRGARMRAIVANALLGLAVMAVGVGYLGNELSFMPWEGFTLFFPGWASLFLIVPGAYWLIRRPLSWFWPVVLLSGVLILLSNQESYGLAKAATIVLAAAIILLGLRIALSPIFKRMRKKKRKETWERLTKNKGHVFFGEATDAGTTLGGSFTSGSNPGAEYAVKLGDRTVNIADEEFTSATVSCHMGNMDFNISRAIITDCAVIDASCSLGNLMIRTPAHARVEMSSTFTSGNLDNHHINPAAPDGPVVYINVSGSLGNVEIF